jgi:hypothetical protein
MKLRASSCERRRSVGGASAGRRRAPSDRLPAGSTAPRPPSGAASQVGNRPATQRRPRCHSRCPKYASSVQQPHGDGRLEGADRVGVRRRGADFHEGGHRGGTTGAAKRCAGIVSPSDGEIRGNRRPEAAHLSLPGAAGPSAARLHTVPVNTSGRASGPPSSSPRPADLGGLVKPPARAPTGHFCRSMARLAH